MQDGLLAVAVAGRRERDPAAVGPLQKAGIARLPARCRVEAGAVEFDRAVLMHRRHHGLHGRKIEVVAVKGGRRHAVPQAGS
ncbi:hypothetical protein D3C87_1979210 [compost metagenome]